MDDEVEKELHALEEQAKFLKEPMPEDEKLSEEELDELEDNYAVRSIHSAAAKSLWLHLRHWSRPIRRSPFSTILLVINLCGFGSLTLALFTNAGWVLWLWGYAKLMWPGALACTILGYYYDRNRTFFGMMFFFYCLFFLCTLGVDIRPAGSRNESHLNSSGKPVA